MLPISVVRWQDKQRLQSAATGQVTQEVSLPSTLLFIFYDKFCSVDMNVHATCIQCVDHLCGDLLFRITMLR